MKTNIGLIFLIVVFSVLTSKVYAQVDSLKIEGYPLPITHLMDSLFSNLDKGRIPHSILYELVFPIADFTGDHSGHFKN